MDDRECFQTRYSLEHTLEIIGLRKGVYFITNYQSKIYLISQSTNRKTLVENTILSIKKKKSFKFIVGGECLETNSYLMVCPLLQLRLRNFKQFPNVRRIIRAIGHRTKHVFNTVGKVFKLSIKSKAFRIFPA